MKIPFTHFNLKLDLRTALNLNVILKRKLYSLILYTKHYVFVVVSDVFYTLN